MKKALCTLLVSFAACLLLKADTITLWDFNSPTPDGNTATGTLVPYIGAGTCTVIGGPAYTFATPAQATTDPEAEGSPADNSGLRTATYPSTSSNNKTAGIQYLASTVGFTGVQLQWDQNNSATASKYWRLQYTTDGTTWVDKDVITAPGNANWVDGHTADFSSIPATANNPNFGFRLVSEFQSTATGSGTAGYVGNSSTYGTSGTFWMDYVVLSGAVTIGLASPQPFVDVGSNLTVNVTIPASASLAGAFTVTLTSDTPGVVGNSSVTIAQGTTSTNAALTILGVGSATITASGSGVASSTLMVGGLRVATFTWTPLTSGNAGGSWATQGNWTGGTLPTAIGDTADFSELNVTVASTVTLDGNQSINSMIFGNKAASPAVNWTMNVGTPATSTLTLGGTTPTITVNNLGSANYARINPVITGTSGLTIAGPTMLELFGANTYSGGTVVSSGSTLGIGISSIYSSGVTSGSTGKGNVTLQNGAAIDNLGSSFQWFAPQLTIQGTVNLAGVSRLTCGFGTIDMNGGTGTINVNSKSLVITKSGSTSSVTGNNEGTGLSCWEMAPSFNPMTFQNGTFDLETTTFAGGNGGAYGTFRFNSASSISFASTANFIVGNAVVLFLNNSFYAASSPVMTINTGGYLDMLDNVVTVNSLAGGGTVALSLATTNTTPRTLTINGTSGTTTFSGVLQNGPAAAAVLSLAKTGASTQILSGQNTYTGNTTVSGGTLTLASGGGLQFVIGANGVNNGISGTGAVNLNGAFNFNLTGADTTVGDSWNIVNVGTLTTTFGGTFSIPGFTYVGSNLWTNGANYYFSTSTGNLDVGCQPYFVTDPPTLLPKGTLYAGWPFTLNANAAGAPPLSFQWRQNGTNILNATNSTYSVASAAVSNSGNYDVVVTNPFASVTNTTTAAVTVVTTPPDVTSGLITWLRFDEHSGMTAHDASGNGRDGALQNFNNDPAQWVPGLITNALSVNPDIYNEQQVVLVTNTGGAFDFSSGLAFTLSAWVYGDPASQLTDGGIITRGFGNGGEQYSLDMSSGIFRFFVRNASATPTVLASSIAPNGAWQHLCAVYSASSGVMNLYINGVLAGSATAPTSLLVTNHDLSIGARQSANYDGAAYDDDWVGLVDDARVYGRALVPAEVQALYNAAPTVAPTVTQDPVGRSVFAGGSVRLSAVVGGTLPMKYQWFNGSAPVTGATMSTLTISNVNPANIGSYSLRVTNGGGYAISGAATVGLLTAAANTYESVVLADAPEAYWRLNETSGAILDSMGRHDGLPYSAAGLDTNGSYFYFNQAGALAGNTDTCVYFDASSQDEVIVPYSPDLNAVPFSIECWVQDVVAQTTYSAPIGCTDTGNKGYVLYATPSAAWEYWLGKGVGYPTSWTYSQGVPEVPNAWIHLVETFDGTTAMMYTNGVLSFSAAAPFAPNLTQPFYIGCNPTYAAGSFFSGYIDEVACYKSVLSPQRVNAHYNLGVYGASGLPAFVPPPAPQTVTVGATATFTATVIGAPTLSYQWQEDGVDIPGATGLTLSVTNVYYTDGGHQYALAATNGIGGSVSLSATLTVMPPSSQTNLVFRAKAGTSGSVLELIWPAGTLYSAPAVTGPWTVVIGATLPYYTISPTNTAMFFRRE